MSDAEIVPFGKYKGSRYDEILKDRQYCEWALKAENPSGALAKLQAYLQTKNITISSNPSNRSDAAVQRHMEKHHGISGMSTSVSFDPRVLSKRQREESRSSEHSRKKGRFSTWLDNGLETAYDDDISSAGDSVGYDADDLAALIDEAEEKANGKKVDPHSLGALDAFGWGSKTPSPVKSAARPAGSAAHNVHVSTSQMPAAARPTKASLLTPTDLASHSKESPAKSSSAADRWLTSSVAKAAPLSQNSAEPPSTSTISYKGTIVMEVCGVDTFRIQVENKRGNRTTLTTFLPNELWSIVARYKSSQVPTTKDGRPVAGTCMASKHYTECVKALKQAVGKGADIVGVPGFVLRAFPAFISFAPPLSLQRKCANIFLKVTSPKTQQYSAEIESCLGPHLLKELKVFQMDGITYGLERNGRVLIGDEMGLGKTLQALAILSIYKKEWPCLIVCPSSIRFQWKDQAQLWLKHCFTDINEELVIVRNGKTKITNRARMIIISYELLTKMTSLHHGIKVVVCDESHYLKSGTAKRSQIIVPMLQNASRAILLSGTPALNKPSELYQQLIALMPDFARYEEFSDRYCEKKKNPWSNKMEYFNSKLTDELNLFLTTSIMVRRLKKDVQQELPDKIRSRVPVELDATLAKEVFAKMKKLDKQPIDPDDASFQAQLDNEDDNNSESAGQTRALISNLFRLTGEAKADSVCEYIDYISDIEDKFIVFAHHKVVLDKIETKLRNKKFAYVRIDGSTPQNQREGLVKKFQETGEARVALLSITACGHGLNMTAAGTAVFAELYWVPGQIMQAEDRCHRMGTTHSIINIHYCIAEKTIDDVVWNCLDRKWNGISSTLDGQKQQFQDDKIGSHKHATWRSHVPVKKASEPRIIERRSSLLITEDLEAPALQLENAEPSNGYQPQRRQSLLDDFVLSSSQ